jgi:transposase, IS5 family
MRRAQRSFGDGLIDEQVKDLREVWMDHADRLLDDEAVVAAIFQALGRRHPRSRTRGRRGSPAEIVLRLLILKHVRNWSYEVLEREVRANLVYRDFTRVGGGKMPDAKTIGRWGLAVGPEAIKQVHERLVRMAQAEGIATGRRMRVDTTVVETNGPLSDRFKPARGRRTGADPGDEEDHRHRRRGRREASRPQPGRQTARARYCASGTRQGTAEPGAA